MTTATKTDDAGARRKSTGNATDARRYEPHGYLIGSQPRPTQITIYAITGGPDRWMRFHLDASRPSGSFVAQALEVVRKTPVVPFHGELTGFAINFSPDHAVRYDADGLPVETLAEPYAPGHVQVFVENREVRWRFEANADDELAEGTTRWRPPPRLAKATPLASRPSPFPTAPSELLRALLGCQPRQKDQGANSILRPSGCRRSKGQ